MASSTTGPIASTSPKSERVLTEKPKQFVAEGRATNDFPAHDFGLPRPYGQIVLPITSFADSWRLLTEN